MKSLAKFLLFNFLLAVAFAVVASDQQIHIKALFIEVPKVELKGVKFGGIITNSAVNLRPSFWQRVGDVTNAVTVTPEPSGWMCIHSREKLKEVIDTLRSRKDFEALAEPEVTTVNGRQTRI